jgi:hypothetical protein
VLVHLNTKLPKYLINNLKRLVTISPSKSVTLISNMNQIKIHGVKNHYVSVEPNLSALLNSNLKHPKSFRSNFWHSAVARFIYLLEYQKETKQPILHFESDILVALDFPFEKFLHVAPNHIAYPILSPKHGIASVFWSPKAELLEDFVSFVIQESSKDSNTNDMLVLRGYYDNYKDKVFMLPAGPVNESCYTDGIIQDLFSELQIGYQAFEGIFDASDIGLYYFGTDPRNERGKSRIKHQNADSYSRMSKFNTFYDADRDFLSVHNGDEISPIFNIHLTSKQQRLFRSTSFRRVFREALAQDEESFKWYPRITLRMIISKLRRHLSPDVDLPDSSLSVRQSG